MRSRSAPDAGSSTLAVVGVIGLAVALAVTVATAGRAAWAAEAARGAADASALAAATRARDLRALGEPVESGPCALALEVAREWGTRLESCAADWRGVVTVEVSAGGPLGRHLARSRAGADG